MNAKIFRAMILVAVILFSASFALPPASADGPIQGLPWSTISAWPTAQPLKLGSPQSAQTQSSPSVLVPVPVQLPVGVIQPNSSTGSIPQNLPAGTIYVTPVPPLNSSAPPVLPVTNPPQTSSVNSGNTRNDALTPTGDWQTLGGGASVWYLVATGGPHIEIQMKAEPHLNVTLDIFAPNESNTPIGRGTPLKSDPTIVQWSGGSWRTNGNWYARVTNYYPAPIRYQLTSSATQIGTKDCYSYWEYIGPNHVYWTRCN